MIEIDKWQQLNDRILVMRLVQKRIEAGLTQEDLAAALGRTVEDIRFLEAAGTDEHDPYLSTIRRYAAAVGAVYEIRVAGVDVATDDEEGNGDGDES